MEAGVVKTQVISRQTVLSAASGSRILRLLVIRLPTRNANGPNLKRRNEWLSGVYSHLWRRKEENELVVGEEEVFDRGISWQGTQVRGSMGQGKYGAGEGNYGASESKFGAGEGKYGGGGVWDRASMGQMKVSMG